jgi:DNA repair/transcription protein MET18/MMS19
MVSSKVAFRLVIYTNQYTIALLKMDKKFMTGYLALADGEKDPRNLMVAFAIARVILIEFDITDYVEVHFISYFYPHLLN